MELILELIKKLLGVFLKTQKLPELDKPEENRFTVTEEVFEKDEPNYIICNGEPVQIDWHKVVLWTEPGGLVCKPEQYKKRKTKRNLKMFVVHWDACLSSSAMAGVLEERGLSIPFAIDNDGTIFQLMDTKHVAWHAKGVNTISAGVEIANAVSLKYQSWYVKHGFGERPIIKDAVLNGKKIKPMLGFYPVQIEALEALIKAMNMGHGIPLKVPTDKFGSLVTEVDERVAGKNFKGVVGHYHITSRKSDPIGLPLDKVVERVIESDKE
jgi:hypothetical protein